MGEELLKLNNYIYWQRNNFMAHSTVYFVNDAGETITTVLTGTIPEQLQVISSILCYTAPNATKIKVDTPEDLTLLPQIKNILATIHKDYYAQSKIDDLTMEVIAG